MTPSSQAPCGNSENLIRQLLTVDKGQLVCRAGEVRDQGHGDTVSVSKKVFIPLTHLCRDVCHYCAFAQQPEGSREPFLSPRQVLDIAKAGAAAGCKEALFTLGDKPELRYRAAREALARLGHDTTVSYLTEMAALVLRETGLLPHVNAGVLTAEETARLRKVSVSQGIMLESAAERLCQPGGPHHGSPDKAPEVRLVYIEEAGRQAVPFTSGLLIGIGETRAERIDSLLALRQLHDRYGHLQELIIQPFRPKPGTRMAAAPTATTDELVWTIVAARLLFGPAMNIQTPPNLAPDDLASLVAAGINDWGGVSPVTPDHVNPEAPWPHLHRLADMTADAGKHLVERLAVYPAYAQNPTKWIDGALHGRVLAWIDSDGFARSESWRAGGITPPEAPPKRILSSRNHGSVDVDRILHRATGGDGLSVDEIEILFRGRGGLVDEVAEAANSLRARQVGDPVTYVVNRNINYTNICTYDCGFCAFSKGRLADGHRDRPYLLDYKEIGRRAAEAREQGATEVCLQGGIHPTFTGQTYLDICDAVTDAAPDIHIHGFSPLEVSHGAETLGISVARFLERLKTAGLGSLPGTAAEILVDEVRADICPDKLSTAAWLKVIRAAHETGLPTTSTIMFGHLETPAHWAQHLIALRDLQITTGGMTEFVPLPFVATSAPIFLKGKARHGPSTRETVLMHAVARLALHPHITNIQVSWPKLGLAMAQRCLNAGANDIGGTLMNESITRAAGGAHGQQMTTGEIERCVSEIGRVARQRTTLYDPVHASARAEGASSPDNTSVALPRVWRVPERSPAPSEHL
jgi:FO synthase